MSLVLPKIAFHKDLKPSQDAQFIAILDELERKGIPFCTHGWSSAAGINLDELLNDASKLKKD